jgi:hypothetical protein
MSSQKLRLPGIDGDGWWASRNWRMTPLKFDLKTGAPQWLKLGRRAPGKAKPGEMYNPRKLAGGDGASDGFIFIPDTLGQMWVWTEAGLYIGSLYHEHWEGIHDGNSIFCESVDAHIYKIDGKIYACAGDHGVGVHEVHLPKLTPVAGAAVTVTPEAAAAAAKPWDPDGPTPGKRPIYAARSIHDFEKNKPVRQISVDGKLEDAEWKDVAAMPVLLDGKNVAEVKAVFDDTTLYLAYAVKDANGLRNAGTELPACPFVSGGYVDFCIGRNWSTPNRDQNVVGDVRVILARIGDKTKYQMGFWPIKANGKNSQTITSPAAQRKFDEIAPVDKLNFAYTVTADGYTLEAAVRFNSLGIDIYQNATMGFDVSVAFSNPEGTVRQRASHWAGESESTVVDRPGSAALLPATWGKLVLDRTCLNAQAK